MKSLAVALLMVSSVAMAQTTPSAPAVTPEVTKKLTNAGYTDIKLQPITARSLAVGTPKPNAAKPVWSGTALKGGKEEHIDVDAKGNVISTK